MKKNSLWLLIFLVFANILAWQAVFDFSGQRFLKVSFLDVGQGDAAFVITPGGRQILVDGGPDAKVLEKLGNSMPFWDRSLDLIILSHPEKDHLSGLLEVLKRYKVENILWSGVKRDTAEYREWISLLQKEGAKVVVAQAGQKIKIGELEIDILSPQEKAEGQQLKDSNDTSVVARFIFGQNSVLFTGDISEKLENNLVKGLAGIKSDILKISHHGSKYSSSEGFLYAVSPKIAVIEVGQDNNFGHPTQDVLARLLKYGIDILRTDQNGDIKFIFDGNKFQYLNN